jgi:hypothetical protein
MATFSSPLPIELLSFEAFCKAPVVWLEWTTASEENTSYFELERSLDGITFETIGTRLAAGNSNSVINYSITDNNAPVSKAYYRLKQFDLDGKYTISDVIIVNCSSTGGISFFPNPATETIDLQINFNEQTAVNIIIYDAIGQVVMQKTKQCNAGNNVLELSIRQLPPAIYTLVVESRFERWTEKLVKVN